MKAGLWLLSRQIGIYWRSLEPISKPPQGDHQAGELGEAELEVDVVFVPRDESPKVLQPADRAFDFPSPAVSQRFPAVLRGGLHAVGAMRANQIDLGAHQTFSQRIAVRGAIVNRSTQAFAQDVRLNQRFSQRDFGGACGGGRNRQWQPATFREFIAASVASKYKSGKNWNTRSTE